MIIHCQFCSKSHRIDLRRYAGKRIKMRCSGCTEIFVADIPLHPVVEENEGVTVLPQILVAHSDPGLCETVGSILSRHDFPWSTCHDGETALQQMDRHPPQVVIVDVALPGLFAFEVVDKVRKRPGLENVKIMLLSSVYNKMAYKRRPHSLYGADDYIEKHHIPLELIDKICRLLEKAPVPEVDTGSEHDRSSSPSEEETIDALKTRLQQAEELEVARDPNEESARLKAERLARIIASDISLYDEEKVAKGIQEGTFFELFATEIAEGRQHFMERVPENLPGRTAILDAAFNDLIERFRQELLP